MLRKLEYRLLVRPQTAKASLIGRQWQVCEEG